MNRQEKLERLAEFYVGAAAGKQVQCFKGHWEDQDTAIPNMDSILDDWRLVDDKKPVDMQVLVDCKIDCAFWDAGELKDVTYLNYNFLGGINASGGYRKGSKGLYWKHCQPRKNYWMYVGNHTVNTVNKLNQAGFEIYRHVENPASVFKITGLRQGYCWPWEVEEQSE